MRGEQATFFGMVFNKGFTMRLLFLFAIPLSLVFSQFASAQSGFQRGVSEVKACLSCTNMLLGPFEELLKDLQIRHLHQLKLTKEQLNEISTLQREFTNSYNSARAKILREAEDSDNQGPYWAKQKIPALADLVKTARRKVLDDILLPEQRAEWERLDAVKKEIRIRLAATDIMAGEMNALLQPPLRADVRLTEEKAKEIDTLVTAFKPLYNDARLQIQLKTAGTENVSPDEAILQLPALEQMATNCHEQVLTKILLPEQRATAQTVWDHRDAVKNDIKRRLAATDALVGQMNSLVLDLPLRNSLKITAEQAKEIAPYLAAFKKFYDSERLQFLSEAADSDKTIVNNAIKKLPQLERRVNSVYKDVVTKILMPEQREAAQIVWDRQNAVNLESKDKKVEVNNPVIPK